jgi:hypothetical protein
MAGAFQCDGDHALVLGAGTCAGTGENFSVWRHKSAQSLRVFIVDRANFITTEVANFFYQGLIVLSIVSNRHFKMGYLLR